MNLSQRAALGGQLNNVLALLEAHFGLQNWWASADSFEVIAGALLVQHTAWTGASKAVGNLQAAGVLSIDGILGLDAPVLFDLVRPSGAYRQKAAKLRAFAAHVRSNHDDDIAAMLRCPTDHLRNELLSIWGVGHETADTIMLYAAHRPCFVLDTYTQRTLERLGVIQPDTRSDELRVLLQDELAANAQQLAEYHALFVQLGKVYCGKKADCDHCPLLLVCRYGSRGYQCVPNHSSRPSRG